MQINILFLKSDPKILNQVLVTNCSIQQFINTLIYFVLWEVLSLFISIFQFAVMATEPGEIWLHSWYWRCLSYLLLSLSILLEFSNFVDFLKEIILYFILFSLYFSCFNFIEIDVLSFQAEILVHLGFWKLPAS